MPAERLIIRTLLLISLSLMSLLVKASPWIGTLEPSLHQDLRVLVEKGHLEVAMTSFPVPWKGIDVELNNLDVSQLDEMSRLAYQRLQHYLQRQKNQSLLKLLTLHGGTQSDRFKGFTDATAEKGLLSLSASGESGRWAYQLSTHFAPGGEKYWDNSFVAYQFGDWNLRLGAIDQWWGPGHASSLILSNNARPVPGLALSRSMATASDSWLSLLGPWYITAQMGLLETDRFVADTKLWRTRFNFRPLSGLEVGLSWAAMWGGEGRDNSLSEFFRILTFRAECADGSKTCDSALDTKAGNHLAGYDVIYSFNWLDTDISLYAQQIGEDAVDYYRVTDKSELFGISAYLLDARWYLESSDTNVACGPSGSTIYNCYYEHHEYRSGYRYRGRVMGSTFDSDAKSLVLGMQRHFQQGSVLQVEAGVLNLNQDRVKPSPVVHGLSEDVRYLKGKYQWPWGDWRLQVKLTAEHSRSEDSDADWHSDISVSATWHIPD